MNIQISVALMLVGPMLVIFLVFFLEELMGVEKDRVASVLAFMMAAFSLIVAIYSIRMGRTL
ncbi:hypothetical protein NGC36_21115 [Serratia rubidaea]|uniref:hypothetical protein n=1 Tax=Serratia rubidaea TaxID=61652 RepID=UPI002DB9179B|nr:hypothetical protein [Serratia rubidaea]MEB7587770.1 hypothetical protein [Serratia rubidaea]